MESFGWFVGNDTEDPEEAYAPVSTADDDQDVRVPEEDGYEMHDTLLSSSSDPIKFMGMQVLSDEASWHYLMVFPLIPPGEAGKEELNKMISKAQMWEKVQEYFQECVFEDDEEFKYLGLEAFEPDEGGEAEELGLSVQEFHEEVRLAIARLLAGPHLGFLLEGSETIDRDELFLKMKLVPGHEVDFSEAKKSFFGRLRKNRTAKFNTIDQLADASNARFALDPHKYPKDNPCPTYSIDKERNFKGQEFIPAAVPFIKEKRHLFAEPSELDLLRVIKQRVLLFLDLDKLAEDDILKNEGFFPVHRSERIAEFELPPGKRPHGEKEYPQGWGHIASLLQWPGDQHTQAVRNYFGEEVAFFFDWMNYFTRMLLPVSVIGTAVFVLNVFELLPGPLAYLMEWLDVGFAIVMVLWSSIFGKLYSVEMHQKVAAWGMNDYKLADVQLPTFEKKRIGTWKEHRIAIGHWLLACLMCVWTVGVSSGASRVRKHFLELGDEVAFLGLTGSQAAQLIKYLITLNITIVDNVWTAVSPIISRWRNYRTETELKEATAEKLFLVKVVVYYYPFWYIAFQEQRDEGCVGDECLMELQSSLLVFMVFHIVFKIIFIVWPMLAARREIRKEMSATSKNYTYLQVQAKLESYTNEADDFLELIISLGLVMQFSSVLPIIPAMQGLSNLLEIRLLAYKMIKVCRRAPGRGMEGIGSWRLMIGFLSWLALIVNVLVAVFFLKPMKTWEYSDQLKAFVLLEHTLFAIKVVVEAALPEINVLTLLIQATNQGVQRRLFSGDTKQEIKVQGPGLVPNIKMSYDAQAQHGDDIQSTPSIVRPATTLTKLSKRSVPGRGGGRDGMMCGIMGSGS